jgi:hypothetical protein
MFAKLIVIVALQGDRCSEKVTENVVRVYVASGLNNPLGLVLHDIEHTLAHYYKVNAFH